MSLDRTLKRVAVSIVAALALTTLTGASASARPVNPFELMTGFAAKEGCSCVFVSEQTDEYCKAFAQPGVAPIAVSIDRSAMTVTGSIAGTSRTARFAAGKGCVLDGLP